MPILTVRLGTAPDPRLAAAVAGDLQALTVGVLGKRAELTAVAVQFVEPAQWFIGGRALDGAGPPSAFVEIRLSAGSNTEAQIADWVAAVHAALRTALGGLHEVSYVQVQEVPAAHWGWGGRTQAARAAEGASPRHPVRAAAASSAPATARW